MTGQRQATMGGVQSHHGMQAGGTGQVSRHQTSGDWGSIPTAVGKAGPAEGRGPGQDSMREPVAMRRAGGGN
eukprot:2959544-Ditylum_brightwellii.AAC.1